MNLDFLLDARPDQYDEDFDIHPDIEYEFSSEQTLYDDEDLYGLGDELMSYLMAF